MALFGSERLDIGRGRALCAVRDVEGDLLRFLEGLVAIHLDGAVMGEEILAAVIRRDESKALRVVEPLHGTCCHCVSFLERDKPGTAYGHDDQGRNWTATRHRFRGT